MPSQLQVNATARERFAAKVDRSGDCWLWTAGRDSDGYGRFRPGGGESSDSPAHRVAWVLEHGAIPNGLMVLHRCDVRACVNPAHLFLGTAADNSADMVAKGRSCRGVNHPNYGRGFPQPRPEQRARGERNGAARLDADMVRAIRAEYAAGARQVDIAARHGVPQAHISRITRRESWAHVD